MNVALSSMPCFFYYTLLGNDVTTCTFDDLLSPNFCPQQASVRLLCKPDIVQQFVGVQKPLQVCRSCLVVFPSVLFPSVLWRCWLGGTKGIRPVKNWVVGCWHGYLAGARCRLAYGPVDATATHCMLLVPADLGSPGQRAVKRVCVCLVVFLLRFVRQVGNVCSLSP